MVNAKLDDTKGQAFFFKILAVVFFIRLAISIWLPMTGDEAYFVVWGKNLDYGYYDHSPFVGWLLAAFLTVSDAAWWLRLPSTLLPLFLSYGIYHVLKTQQPNVAAWVALTFLVAPVNIINVLITTDIPLVFFSFISAWFFYLALTTEGSKKYFLLAGLFLGFSFLSKYFAIFLGLSYGFYILLFSRQRKNLVGLGLILLMAAPFVGLNLLWNYNNCWNNILFNLYNRTASTVDVSMNLIKYAGMLLYLFSPLIVYFVIKNKSLLKQQWINKVSRIYIWLAFFPLILFLLLLLRKEIGLHWVFSFYPFAFIALAGLLTQKQWRWTFHFMWVFALIHVLALSSIMLLPVKTFASKTEAVENLTLGKYPKEVLEKLKPYEKDYTFATISYGLSSVLSYYSRKHVIVFDIASFHGREDDNLTNYKKLDGQNILIFKRTVFNIDKLSRFFKESERKSIKIREATFELLIGHGFKYDLYKQEILSAVNKDFYTMPNWLPAGQCGYKSKYGFSND